MRYAQANAIVSNLLLDAKFSELSLVERQRILDRLLSEIRGRMIADAVGAYNILRKYFREEGNMRKDRNGFVPENVSFVDAFDQQVDGEFLNKLLEIAKKEKPIYMWIIMINRVIW